MSMGSGVVLLIFRDGLNFVSFSNSCLWGYVGFDGSKIIIPCINSNKAEIP